MKIGTWGIEAQGDAPSGKELDRFLAIIEGDVEVDFAVETLENSIKKAAKAAGVTLTKLTSL